MKKLSLVLISMGCIFTAFGYDVSKLDTLYANNNMNTALFFPTDIRQGITGADNFVFTYNREKEQNLGLLKATPGKASNLLVITTDGKVYSYIIRYAEKLPKVNYFLLLSESIGDERKKPAKVFKMAELEETTPLDNAHNKVGPLIKGHYSLKTSCAALLKLPERKNIVRRNAGISLAIKNKVYQGAHVYIQFEIENNSGIDFDLDFLKLYKRSGNKKRRASFQELFLKPVFTYNLPNRVKYGETIKFVYVLPKFTLDKNEKVLVKLKERYASRALALKFM